MGNNQINEKSLSTTKENESKKYNLKNDVIFKYFFAKKGNEKFLIDFLTGLLKTEIRGITIKEEVNLLKMSNDQKGGRLDLQAKLDDGTIVSIEMQVNNEGNIEYRTDFYSAYELISETEKGTKYEDIKQIITINILNFNLFDDIDDYVSYTVNVLNKHRDHVVDSLITHYFIELPKFREQSPDMNDKLNQWLAVIDDMDEGRIKMAKKNSETIKTAVGEIEVLTGDAEVKRMAELHEKWERDRISGLSYAEKKGMQEGEKKAKLETAKKMLEKDIDIETIAEVTELTKEEILKMKD